MNNQTTSNTGFSNDEILGFASTVTGMFSNVTSNLNARAQAKADAQTARANALITLENIKAVRGEYALNLNVIRGEAKETIDTSRAAMIASGNVGSSADASVEQAYKNLSSSLSNMQFNYESRVTALKNEYNEYLRQEKIAKMNAKRAGLSNILGVTTAVAGGVIGGVVGGPAGAMAGASIGQSLGQAGASAYYM